MKMPFNGMIKPGNEGMNSDWNAVHCVLWLLHLLGMKAGAYVWNKHSITEFVERMSR